MAFITPYKITLTTNGKVYQLNGTDPITGYEFNYQGDGGFGLSPLHRITQRGTFQQGDFDTDFRLDPRVLSLPLLVMSPNLSDHYQKRDAILKIFTPSNTPAILTVTVGVALGDDFVRSISVMILGGLTFDHVPGAGYDIRFVVQLRAADPTWYDPTGLTVSTSAAIAGTPTPYPKPYPVPYGVSALSGNTKITYGGSWQSYPIITATGPITGLLITNQSTGAVISVPGVIPAGRTWTFNLLYGYKTVTDDLGVNQIAAVTAASDLATFAIVPAPAVSDGVNIITATGTVTTGASATSLFYFNRYVGV